MDFMVFVRNNRLLFSYSDFSVGASLSYLLSGLCCLGLTTILGIICHWQGYLLFYRFLSSDGILEIPICLTAFVRLSRSEKRFAFLFPR